MEGGKITEYIYGRRPVLEALRGQRRVAEVYIAQNLKASKVVEELTAAALARRIKTIAVEAPFLESVSDQGSHQGVAAQVSAYRYADVAELIRRTAGQERALIVAVDGVTDPQNFGAIVRTGLCAGADGFVIPKHRAVAVTPAVVKASAGATEHMAIARFNLNQAFAGLKSAGFWLVGADAGVRDDLWDLDLSGKIVLVFGGEGQGLSKLVKDNCDFLAKLPIYGPVESLNVSAAAAVMIYEVVRQRR